MRRYLLLIPCLWLTFAVKAQMVDPVHFHPELKLLDNDEAEIVFSASIDAGWHVYSTDLGQGGPIEASFYANRMEGATLVGKLKPRGNVTEKYDDMFGMTLKFFENSATFVQRIKFTQPHYDIDCYLEYGACDDKSCLPPTHVDFKTSGEVELTKPKEEAPKPDTLVVTAVVSDTIPTDSMAMVMATDSAATDITSDSLWKPIIDELRAFDKQSSLWFIFLSGLLAGFLAVLTPCVWPIIPMTVSFFLKRNKERRKAIREALTYGLSIVVIYVLLGLVVTLLFEASSLNALSTNAVFNIFFALLLIVFAASFFGAFELTLPSSWSNKIDRKSESATGILSIFLMAFTLALVSFSCTGPIVGFLLVAISTQGEIVGPTIGMLGFAIGLAIPFSLFAIFPSLLKSAPKSGGWMNTVKVVLGFIELAFALKFLSVADLSYKWHLLDREVFLSLWIVLFALLGAYLLGWLKFPHDEETRKTNVPQFFLGLISLAFAVYMVPGLWGAPLKAISAFSPPMYTQDFNLYSSSVEAQYTDYDLGMAAARAEGKPVIVDFTGYGCTNCRKMEAAVWTDPTVRDLLNDKYVLISLYVDDKTPLPQPIDVFNADGTPRQLITIGDKWSYFESIKIGANIQPCYLLLDPSNGKPLNKLRYYDEDISAYTDFLQQGLARFKN